MRTFLSQPSQEGRDACPCLQQSWKWTFGAFPRGSYSSKFLLPGLMVVGEQLANVSSVCPSGAVMFSCSSVDTYHGCCWETFYMFAYCGLVGNPHLASKIQICAPLPTSTKLQALRKRRKWKLRLPEASYAQLPTCDANFRIRK